MSKFHCPHCGTKLGNYLYADACPNCRKVLEQNMPSSYSAPAPKSAQDKAWPIRWFLRAVRFVES